MKKVVLVVTAWTLVCWMAAPCAAAELKLLSTGKILDPVTIEPERLPGDPISLVLDDGSSDNSIGIGGSTEFIHLNRFSPTEFPVEITEVQIFFPGGGTTNISVGDPFTVYLWANTAGNADPSVGATYVGGQSSTIAVLDDWTTVTLTSPIAFSGPGDVLVGVIYQVIPGTATYPAALDTTTSQTRSWAGWWTTTTAPDPPTLPPDSSWGTIDSLDFPGNWLIRAYGSVTPVELLSFDIR